LKKKHENYLFDFICIKAVSNFEMNTFGPNFQARVFPEGKKKQKTLFYVNYFLLVVICLFISMICCSFVHRVCVTTW
jgi:hypothetical protein